MESSWVVSASGLRSGGVRLVFERLPANTFDSGRLSDQETGVQGVPNLCRPLPIPEGEHMPPAPIVRFRTRCGLPSRKEPCLSTQRKPWVTRGVAHGDTARQVLGTEFGARPSGRSRGGPFIPEAHGTASAEVREKNEDRAAHGGSGTSEEWTTMETHLCTHCAEVPVVFGAPLAHRVGACLGVGAARVRAHGRSVSDVDRARASGVECPDAAVAVDCNRVPGRSQTEISISGTMDRLPGSATLRA